MLASAEPLLKKASVRRYKTQVEQRRRSPAYSFVVSMLRPHSHRWQARLFRYVIMSLIILDIAAFVFETDDHVSREFSSSFYGLETVSSVVFLGEYVLRVCFAPARQQLSKLSPWNARLQWVCSLESIIDLASFLPWFIELLFANDLPNLSVVRVLRIVRILKASPVCGSFDLVARVVYYNSQILGVALLICFVMILGTSTLLYYWKPPGDTEDDFSSILATMYLSVMMLTGQGQPAGELPWYTKLTVVVTAVFAVAQFAIPASMLTWGFEQEASRLVKDNTKKVRARTAAILAGEVDPVSSSSSDEDDRAKLWEGYEDEVLGSSGSESSDSSAGSEPDPDLVPCTGTLTDRERRCARAIFKALDRDSNGRVDTEQLAAITKKGGATELMKQLDPDEDGETEIRDFFGWLATIKRRYSYQVFAELLRQMEAKTAPAPAANEGVAAGAASDIVRRLEEEVQALRGRNAKLERQNVRLEAEVARLKR